MKTAMIKWILSLVALTAPLGSTVTAEESEPGGYNWYDYRDASFGIVGKGSADNPIVVTTAGQLAQIAWLSNTDDEDFYGKVIKLDNDIDLKQVFEGVRVKWTPICKDAYFMGTFDGNGHSITGMYIDDGYNPSSAPSQVVNGFYGLFGRCNGWISNLQLRDAKVTVRAYVSNYRIFAGLLCGSSIGKNCKDVAVEGTMDIRDGYESQIGGIYGFYEHGEITHCTAKVSVYRTGTVWALGGICGRIGSMYSGDGVIEDCTADVCFNGMENGTDNMGGIVGIVNEKSIVKGCASTGTMIEQTGRDTGGICGYQSPDSKILACVSTVTIAPTGYVSNIGGITGNMPSGSGTSAVIDGCAYAGYIDGSRGTTAGGIVGLMGWDKDQHISNSLFLGTMTATNTGKGYGAIVGKNSKPVETIGACYYDSQLYSGPIAEECTSHPSVRAVSTRDLTSGKQDVVSMLPMDETADYGFTMREGSYPTVFCKNCTVFTSGAWLAATPAVIQYGDCAEDFVSTVTVANRKGSWTEDNGRTVNINSTCTFPDTPCLSVDGETATAVTNGKCLLTISSHVSAQGGNAGHPKPIGGSRQVMLNVTADQVWDGTIGTAYAAGTGIAEDPYIIKTGAQLAYAVLNNKEGEFYEQICDITLYKNRHIEPDIPEPNKNIWIDPYSWPKDKDNKLIEPVWNATYDGKGHYVRGLYVGKAALGLFGDIGAGGSVTNLGIIDSHALMRAGLFAGKMDGTINNCIAQGTVGMLHSSDADYYKNYSGGICSLVGASNASAVIEDCISAVNTGSSVFDDFSPFVSLSDNNKGTVRHCLSVVPIIHQDVNFENNGITVSGKRYIQDCYWLKGYEEANSGQTLEGISEQLGKRRQWQTSNGYFPTLTAFAGNDMAKLLTVPFRTDIDYDYDNSLGQSDNYLYGFGRQIPFEPGTATWTCTDAGSFYMEADADMGVIVPVRESFNPSDYHPGNKSRNLGGLVYMTGTMGKYQHHIPMRPTKGAVNAGITFIDDNARQACLDAFDSNHDGNLSLTELKAVSNEQTLTAFQTTTARSIRQFPEFRYFKNVSELTSQLNGMTSLEEVTMPYALKTIGSEAFKDCSSLKEVYVSSKVTSVKPRAFYGSSVETITVDPFNDTFTSRDGVLFTKKDELVAYPNGRDGEEASVAGTVKRIAEGAFYKVPNLQRLFFDTTDYTTVPELANGAITPELQNSSTPQLQNSSTPELLDIYVSDATNDQTLFKAYRSSSSWAPYNQAGKLHQYYPLKVPEDVTVTIGGVTRYVGTFYIGFATQLPDELTPYVVNSLDAENYTAYIHEKNRLVPASRPVMVYADRPGLFRLLPVEGEVETWPVYGNWLIGAKRDGLRVNQSTSAQGSILTPQMNDEGQMAFLYEKKKLIEPYHCYLTFPTIDQSASLVKDAHYDVAYSEHSYGTVTRGDYTFDIRILYPDAELYAVLTDYQGNGGNITVPAVTTSMYGYEAPVTHIAPGAFKGSKGDIWSIDMSQLDDLEPIVANRSATTGPLSGLDPRTIVYLPKGKSAPADNVVVGEECQKLMLTDLWDFCPPYEFHAKEATYDRVLRATDNGDGTWSSKAYTLCLPYSCHFDTGVEGENNITFYKLETVTDNYEFVFSNMFNFYSAGQPAVVVVNKGEYHLNTTNADVIVEPYNDDDNNMVYDTFEGALHQTGTQVGWWQGTFRTISNEEGSEMHCFVMGNDGYWRIIRNDSEYYRTGYIGPFRSFFLPLEHKNNHRYTPKFIYTENGENDTFEMQDFPADTFDGDMPAYDDDVVNISPVIHTIDSDGTHRYYDLQGRPLSGRPAHGIYIYKGKKNIK